GRPRWGGRRVSRGHGGDASVPGRGRRGRHLVHQARANERMREWVVAGSPRDLDEDAVTHGAREMTRGQRVADDVSQHPRLEALTAERGHAERGATVLAKARHTSRDHLTYAARHLRPPRRP